VARRGLARARWKATKPSTHPPLIRSRHPSTASALNTAEGDSNGRLTVARSCGAFNISQNSVVRLWHVLSPRCLGVKWRGDACVNRAAEYWQASADGTIHRSTSFHFIVSLSLFISCWKERKARARPIVDRSHMFTEVVTTGAKIAAFYS